MDAAIAELLSSGGASMYRGVGGQAAGPSMQAQANVFAGGSFGTGGNGTAIVLMIAVIGLAWFYWANRGFMK